MNNRELAIHVAIDCVWAVLLLVAMWFAFDREWISYQWSGCQCSACSQYDEQGNVVSYSLQCKGHPERSRVIPSGVAEALGMRAGGPATKYETNASAERSPATP